MEKTLPIWDIHDPIVRTLQTGNRLVLVAPTGSGKTTQVPQMVLDAGLAGDKKVVVLQPRRVAARTVAARVAWERNCELGGEVGYQIRFDDVTSLGTRICFVTEGILLRWLQDDAALSDVGVLMFDEFHERNLMSDVALALVKQIQQTRRPDLKMVVMSATLDAEPVANYLGGCPVLVSEGQSYPVEVYYIDVPDERPRTDQAADAVERIVNSGEPGDILVFMPGMGEIASTLGALRAARTSERLALIPLHGELQPEEQDLAFAPNPLRKVVVATNVAETSVTIDGIRHVVDGGDARVARYDSERGIGTLFIEEISRASADQRKGRAGRTAPGTCHRLWTESNHLNRPARNTPEIQRADLAEVVLLLHSLHIKKAATFDWLDKPDAQAVERAEKLLHTLGAIDPVTEELTAAGRQMLRLPMHPRYSRILVEAAKRNCVRAAALCAALVSGRDLLQRLRREDKHIADARELFEASQDSDFFTLMRAYQFAKNGGFNPDQCRRYGVHALSARQVEQTFQQIVDVARRQRMLEAEEKVDDKAAAVKPDDDALLRCLMAGFVDQLCIRRDQGTLDCDMTEGRSGILMRESVVQNSPLFVAASIREVAGRGSENLTLLGLASAVKREWIMEMFPQHLNQQVEHLFDRTHKRVAAVKLVRFQDLVIHHEHQREVEPLASGRCLAEAYRKGMFELPLLNHEVKQFIARVNLVCAAMPELEFPPLDDAALIERLAHAFAGMTLVKEAQATHVREEIVKHLAPEQRGWLDELVPLLVSWPDGRKLKLQYQEAALDEDGEPSSPELQVKLTECFQLKDHPHVCEGKLPVKVWLCSPDGKRIESTFNWPAFKTNTYPKLKPGLQKKYPGMTWL
ncbi:MAG: ATP-dependent helicase HrpB [Verrucomicrobia bacterium]|nr:ATP-dependent helicase HrpB [Verrucomicrobiota bacterium]